MKTMTYFVYIVTCSDNTLYTGITKDISKRIREHNGECKGGATYTRSRRPVQLTYSEEYKSKSEALKREYAIKQLSKIEKMALIST